MKGKPCKVYVAPFDVRLPRMAGKNDEKIYTVVQPDICDLAKLDKNGCIGATDIVIEILSQGNNKKELKIKYEVYEESGVKEYWIISPQNKFIFTVYTCWKKVPPFKINDFGRNYKNRNIAGFELILEDVFSGISD